MDWPQWKDVLPGKGEADMMVRACTAMVILPALLLAVLSCSKESALSGRWQYVQPPDTEGDVLYLATVRGEWNGFMNGLAREGEHGLFYYVVEVEELAVSEEGRVNFTVGRRGLHNERPGLSNIGSKGDAGFSGTPMLFSGRMEGGSLLFECTGEDCPDTIMRFEKMQ